MKMHELIQFKTKLEDKREMFILPSSLPDNEWQIMLSRAKIEACNSEDRKENTIYSFLSSMRLSLALSFAIILAVTITYTSYSSHNNVRNTERTNSAIAPRVSPPAVNVSIGNYI